MAPKNRSGTAGSFHLTKAAPKRPKRRLRVICGAYTTLYGSSLIEKVIKEDFSIELMLQIHVQYECNRFPVWLTHDQSNGNRDVRRSVSEGQKFKKEEKKHEQIH